MGYLLREANSDLLIVSMNVAYGAGQAWVCFPDEPCGVQSLGGKGDETEGVTMFPDFTKGSFDGQYFVGPFSAGASRRRFCPKWE